MNTDKSSIGSEGAWAKLLDRACRYDVNIENEVREGDIGLVVDYTGTFKGKDRLEKAAFLRSFTERAIEKALQEGHSPDDDATLRLIEEARETAQEVIYSLEPYGTGLASPTVKRSDTEDEQSFLRRIIWLYRMRPPPILRTDPEAVEVPLTWPDRAKLEDAVQKYVESRWRHPFADRMIVRLLLEFPTAEFLVALTKKGPTLIPLAGVDRRSDRRSHLEGALRPYFWLRLIGFAVAPLLLPLVVFFGLSIVATTSDPNIVVSPALMIWSFSISVLIAFAISVTIIVVGLRKRPAIRAYSKAVVEAFQKLNHALDFTKGDGPLSVSELKREAHQMRSLEILPQMLFVMIDLFEKEGRTYV